MSNQSLVSTVQSIVKRSTELKNTYTDAVAAPVEFACIFCHSEEEYEALTREIETKGDSGGYAKRGDADFNTDYEDFKKRYGSDPKFELIKRSTFEMLRLSDPAFDVMACFSSIPKSSRRDW